MEARPYNNFYDAFFIIAFAVCAPLHIVFIVTFTCYFYLRPAAAARFTARKARLDYGKQWINLNQAEEQYMN